MALLLGSPAYAGEYFNRYNQNGLGTQAGVEMGGTVSIYQYKEPNLYDDINNRNIDVKLDGENFGFTLGLTQKFGNTRRWFGRFESRFAYGLLDYSGSGKDSGQESYYFDNRILFGKDYYLRRSSWTPYTGLGYRILEQDGRGTTVDNGITYKGYRRESQYVYIPFGIMPRFALNSFARLSTQLEYDLLIHGRQNSYLGDVGPGYGTLKNDQKTGYGFRGSIMYERQHWAFGPYVNYWNIAKSDTACSASVCGYEPHNTTTEAGLELRYHF